MRDTIERLVLDILRCLLDIQMEMSSRQLKLTVSGLEIKFGSNWFMCGIKPCVLIRRDPRLSPGNF